MPPGGRGSGGRGSGGSNPAAHLIDVRVVEFRPAGLRDLGVVIRDSIVASQKVLAGLPSFLPGKGSAGGPTGAGGVLAGLAGLGRAAGVAAAGLLTLQAVSLASPGTIERFKIAVQD